MGLPSSHFELTIEGFITTSNRITSSYRSRTGTARIVCPSNWQTLVSLGLWWLKNRTRRKFAMCTVLRCTVCHHQGLDLPKSNVISGAPEYFRGETDRSRQQSIKQARPAKDVWALACVISEAAVWSVLGQRGLDEYHRQRVKATDAIPTLRNSGYSGCFHDTTEVLSVVGEMHKQVNERCRAAIDNVVSSVLLIVRGMMKQDPASRPDARTVYDNLTQAIDLATPSVHPPFDDRITQPAATDQYNRYSVPVNPSPSMTNGLGVTMNAGSRPLSSDAHGYQPGRPPERRTTISGDRSPRPNSGASSIRHGRTPRHEPYSPTADTIHEWQRTPLAPIRSYGSQPNASVSQKARPSASITQVLEHIWKKKHHLPTTLQGEQWLGRLDGRDQVMKSFRVVLGAFADHIPPDLPN